MPLNQSVAREPIHTRAITGNGYRRADGLWDVEGHLVDTKSYAFANEWRTEVAPGEPLHEMWIRLTIDDNFTVVAIECASDETPHATCGAILPNFQRVVGLQIGPGWNKRVKAAVGGAQGCAHHVELLGLLATIAFQTVGPALARYGAGDRMAENKRFLINSCHVWREGGEWAEGLLTDPEMTLAGTKSD